MTIRFACPNGHQLAVQEFLASKRGKCPKCAAPIVVPQPVVEQVADLEALEPLAFDPLGAPGAASDRFADLPVPAAAQPVAQPAASPLTADAPQEMAQTEETPFYKNLPYIIPLGAGALTFLLVFSVGAMVLLRRGKPSPAPQNAAPAATAQAVPSPPPAASDATPTQTNAVAAAPAKPAEALSVVRLQAPAQAFAMNHETGDLAAVSAKSAELYLYSPEYQEKGAEKVIGPIQAGVLPVTIAFKRYKDKAYYIVGDMNESKLRLFESETLQSAGEIDIGVRHVSTVSSPRNPDSPHIFYTGYNDGDRNHFLHRANLATTSDEGKIAENVLEVEAAAYGDFVYARGDGSPSSVRIISFRDGGAFAPMRPEIRHGKHESSAPVIADPYESWVIAYNTAYKATAPYEGTGAGTFEFTPKCFVSNRPFVAGVRDQELCVASLNGLKPGAPPEAASLQRQKDPNVVISTLAKMPIPQEVLPTPAPMGQGEASHRLRFMQNISQHSVAPDMIHDEFRLFSPPQGDRLVLVHQDALFSASLASLGLPNEPRLAAKIDGPSEITLGQTLSAKVQTQEGVALRLAEGPDGMSLASGVLTGTPTTKQVGEFTATLQLTAHGIAETQDRHFRVLRPHIACSFPTERLEISPDGRLALALGQVSPPANKVFDPLQKTRLAVVDLVNSKVIAERELDFPVLLAAIDEHYAYVSTTPLRTKDCELLVLSREDLSELHRYPISIGRGGDSTKDASIASLAGKFLVADTVRSLPDLKPVLPKELQSNWALGNGAMLVQYRPLSEGWLFDGIVYDKEFQKIQLFWGYRDPSSKIRVPGEPGSS